jgi:hypothetical protein
MDLELTSGIKISIQESGNSKIVLFDKPVKTMELSGEESARLGAALKRNGRTGVTAELRNLIDAGFFKEPKTFHGIKTELFQKGVETKATSLNMLISKMVERGELTRIGKKGAYTYSRKDDKSLPKT